MDQYLSKELAELIKLVKERYPISVMMPPYNPNNGQYGGLFSMEIPMMGIDLKIEIDQNINQDLNGPLEKYLSGILPILGIENPSH